MPLIIFRATIIHSERLWQDNSLLHFACRGLSLMTSAKISDFLTPSPLDRKFTQPPLLRLLNMSAFEGNPLPPQCGRHKWKPPLCRTVNSSLMQDIALLTTHKRPKTADGSRCFEGSQEIATHLLLPFITKTQSACTPQRVESARLSD